MTIFVFQLFWDKVVAKCKATSWKGMIGVYKTHMSSMTLTEMS